MSEKEAGNWETGSLFDRVSKMPKELTEEDLDAHISEIIDEINHTKIGEKQIIYNALEILKEQPLIAMVLINRYKSLPQNKWNERFLLIQLIGEMRLRQAYEFFKMEIWKTLPDRPSTQIDCMHVSLRDEEEKILVKAVDGLAYYRYEQSNEDLERIMTDHESYSVRIEAINAFMWNNGDSQESAKILYTVLPSEFHPYVERPRFRRGMNNQKFFENTINWIEKWSQDGKLPLNPKVVHLRKREQVEPRDKLK